MPPIIDADADGINFFWRHFWLGITPLRELNYAAATRFLPERDEYAARPKRSQQPHTLNVAVLRKTAKMTSRIQRQPISSQDE